MRRLSLSNRLALLFAACTAVVSLSAGVLFSRASEAHFIELDQQLLDGKLPSLRMALSGVSTATDLRARQSALQSELNHQPDLALRINGSDGQLWFDSLPTLPTTPPSPGELHTLSSVGTNYRVYTAPLQPDDQASPQLTLLLDITHHQHF